MPYTIKDKKYINREIKTGVMDQSGKEVTIMFVNQIAYVDEKFMDYIKENPDFEIIAVPEEVEKKPVDVDLEKRDNKDIKTGSLKKKS